MMINFRCIEYWGYKKGVYIPLKIILDTFARENIYNSLAEMKFELIDDNQIAVGYLE